MKTAAGAFLTGEGSYESNSLSAKRQSLTLPAKPQDNPALTAKPIDLSPLVKEGATALLVELEKALGTDQQIAVRLDSRRLGVALSPEQLHDVRQIIAQVIPGAQVWVYGSRATGKARPFSDLDLLVTQPPRLDWAQRAALRDGFEASRLPFRVDVVESAGLAFGMAERIEAERVNLMTL